MSNTFFYEQGWLVEKADREIVMYKSSEELVEYYATLRRFKYDYPDPGKVMELGKDFTTQDEVYSSSEYDNTNLISGWYKTSVLKVSEDSKAPRRTVAIPITQRTYSEQEALIERKDLFDKYVELEEKITTKILDIEDSELMDMWLDWQEKRNILNTDWLKTIESLSLK